MSNTDNLIPVTMRSKEEARALSSKGGRNSVKSRRLKKETAELIKMLLDMTPEMSDKNMKSLKQFGYSEKKDGKPTINTMIAIMAAKNAMNGDLNAAKFLYDYGLIPDMKAQLERERMEAMSAADAPAQQGQNNMQTIAALVNAPLPDVDIADLEGGEDA